VSETVGEVVIRIRTDESGVDVAGSGKRAGEGYSRGFLGSIKGIALGIGAVLATRKVLDFAKDSLAEARESQKVGAATAQIIKSTGSAAGLTAKQVGDLSSALSLKTGIDDELIQSGQNLILTFKNVKNAGDGADAIFDRTTKAALDLSAAGFGSVQSASVQLGKALNDPIKGMSALARSGVTFTQAQQDQIKALVASGDLLGAQKVILGEVEGQVGGVAEATATAGEKATTAWNNVKEAVGTALLPILDRLLNFFTSKIAPALLDVVNGTSGVNTAFRTVAKIVRPVLAVIGAGLHDLSNGVKVFRGVLSGQGGAIDTNGPFVKLGLQLGSLVKGVLPEVVAFVKDRVVPIIQGLAAQFTKLAKGALPEVMQFVRGQLLPVLRDLFGQLLTAAQTILPVMQKTFTTKVLPAIKSLAEYVAKNVLPIFGQLARIVVNDLVPLFVELYTIIYGTLYPAVIAIAVAVITRLKPVFDQLVTTFRTSLLPTLQKLIEQVRTQLLPVLVPLVKHVLVVVGAVLKLAASILAVLLPPIIKLIGWLLAHLIPVIVSVVVFLVKLIDGIIKVGIAIAHGITDVAHFVKAYIDFEAKVVKAVLGIPGKIIGVVKDMAKAGRKLIGGLLDGILSAAKGVGGVVASIATSIKDAVVGVINDMINLLNNAIPNKIPIPGAPDVNLPDNPIPHLATGTDSWRGGTALVGEQGPELVRLPRGAQVLPADRTAAALAGAGGPLVHIDTVMPHNYGEFQRQLFDASRVAALSSRRPLSARPVGR
jgi:phage-related protein